MGLRFKLFAVLFLMGLLVTNEQSLRPFGNILDVFLALGVLILLSGLALWPNSERADRVDRAVGGTSWADRIEFNDPPR